MNHDPSVLTMKQPAAPYRAPCLCIGDGGAECGKIHVPLTEDPAEVNCPECSAIIAGSLRVNAPALLSAAILMRKIGRHSTRADVDRACHALDKAISACLSA